MLFIVAMVWFAFGGVIGAIVTLGHVMHTEERELQKRNRRSSDWQKTKKQIDRKVKDEMGVL